MLLRLSAQRRATQRHNEQGHKSTRLTMADTVIEAEMMCEWLWWGSNELHVERRSAGTSFRDEPSQNIVSLTQPRACRKRRLQSVTKSPNFNQHS